MASLLLAYGPSGFDQVKSPGCARLWDDWRSHVGPLPSEGHSRGVESKHAVQQMRTNLCSFQPTMASLTAMLQARGTERIFSQDPSMWLDRSQEMFCRCATSSIRSHEQLPLHHQIWNCQSHCCRALLSIWRALQFHGFSSLPPLLALPPLPFAPPPSSLLHLCTPGAPPMQQGRQPWQQLLSHLNNLL